MTIKEQIYHRIEQIKKEFREETGIELVAYTPIDLEKREIEYVGKTVEEISGQKIYRNKSKKQEVVRARTICGVILSNMGYRDTEIAHYLGGDRSNLNYYREKHTILTVQEPSYKRMYNKVMTILTEEQKAKRNGK